MPQYSKPKVSIVMPVYNAGRYLWACLHSITNQTFEDFEVICVDDGSTDDTWEILNEIIAIDRRFRVLRNSENLGISKTLNRAISHAKGQYLARMDADDIMTNTRLTLQINFLDNNPGTVIVGGQVTLINEHNTVTGNKSFPIEHEAIKKMLYTSMPLQHPTVMINRRLLPNDFVFYDESYITAEDVLMLFKLLNYGKFANLPQNLLYYRLHDNSISSRKIKDLYKLTFRARRTAVKYYGYVPSFKSRFISAVQQVAILILPDRYLMGFYFLFRKLLVKMST